MAFLAAGRNVMHQLQTDTLMIPVRGGATLWPGALVCSDHNGYATRAYDHGGYVFEGVALFGCDANGVRIATSGNKIDNSGGDDGDVYVVVQRRGRIRVACDHIVDQSMMSALAFVVDDQTVAVNPWAVTNDVPCGRVDRIISASELEISIDCYTHCAPETHTPSSTTTTTAAPTTTTTVAPTTTTTAQG